jgi:N-acetylneuraminate synthase
MQQVRIGNRLIGPGQPIFFVAEIGINHNGSLDIAKLMIDEAVECGCDAVKFQKRTVDVVYTAAELARPRENPFGPTNGDLKRGLEFGQEAYAEIDRYCRQKGILWFSSCWDPGSVDFLEQFDPPCYKIASASLTDDDLLRYHRKTGRPIILSTGMSDLAMIHHAVDVLGKQNLVVLNCVSLYPCKPEEINLRGHYTLQKHFEGVPIGYSGHEIGLSTTVAAAAMGACLIERHFTLSRAMWGSDQSASVEPGGLKRLVRDIRVVERAMGTGEIKLLDAEIPIMEKLRRVIR